MTYTLAFILSFFFNDTATTEIYTLSLHDALPIWLRTPHGRRSARQALRGSRGFTLSARRELAAVVGEDGGDVAQAAPAPTRSEEHTSELQSRQYLVCRLLLEKKT